MKFSTKYILLGILISFFSITKAQIDDEYLGMLLEEEDEVIINSAFKPVIGFGQGVFTYFGDIRNVCNFCNIKHIFKSCRI